MFLIQFYKFVLFLKSITKLVKQCNKNDEIKALGFSGQTYIGMPISVLNGTGVDILMWVYTEWS